MKDKSFTQSSDEREAAFEYLVAELPSESLNSSPERKRAIYGAFEARDARFDGRVYAAISSTGVYCRPMCPYHAKIENVTFYATAAEAEEAGYRPCLVCRPETAPGLSSADARKSLARRAAAMIQEGCTAGDGGTADAIREELATGNPVGGRSHIQKGRERLRQIERMLQRNPDHPDRALLERLRDDLRNALEGN